MVGFCDIGALDSRRDKNKSKFKYQDYINNSDVVPMSRPTLLNLETALWVNRLGSFTGAAQKMHTTQPAVSQRIRELETSVSMTLFERHGHRMEPTVEGRDFLHRIEPLVAGIQEVLGGVTDEATARGVVRIGSGDIPMTWFGPVTGRLRARMPGVNYEVHIGIASRLLAQLEEGALDIVLVAGQVEYPTLTSTSLGRTAMRWVMASDRWARFGQGNDASESAAANEPTLVQLLDAGPIWLIPRDSQYFPSQAAVLKAQGANLRNLNGCDTMSALTDLVTNNGGLGYLPQVLIEDRLARGELVEVQGLAAGEAEYFIVSTRGRQQQLVQKVLDFTVRESRFSR